MLRYNVSMDFCLDYSNMVKVWMQKNGIKTDKAGWDLWYEFFNLQQKTVRARKRKVLFSNEFTCPFEVQAGLDVLVNKFENGENVVPYLSKDAFNPSKFDGLLYDWGIYHFHLGSVDLKTGHIKRTGPVLFAWVNDDAVYCINIYSHGKNVPPPWYKKELIQIIHNNWPELIKQWKLPELTQLVPHPTDDDYKWARQEHLYTCIEIAEGTVYAPPGRGLTSSGHSSEVVLLCNSIWNTLKRNELYIKEHISSFISVIQARTGVFSYSKKLYFKLWYEDKEFYVVDIGSQTALLKVDLP